MAENDKEHPWEFITFAAAAMLMITMGARQSLGLFVAPLNTTTGLGIVTISFAMHNKPCGLLNVCGYYQSIVQFLDSAVEQDFLKPKHRALLIVEVESSRLLDRFEQFIATHGTQGFDRSQT